MTAGAARHDAQGQAMVEFAIVFPVQLFLTLVLLQLAHLYVGKLVVNHAAFAAVRAALVKPDDATWNDWITDEVKPAAVMVCAPITGVSDAPATPNTITIPGWSAGSMDELARSGIADVKTRVTVSEAQDDRGRWYVTAAIEHDFELIFLADVDLMDIFSRYDAPGLPLAQGYNSPHLTLHESCRMPRTWDVTPP
jgi:hypothetical protein